MAASVFLGSRLGHFVTLFKQPRVLAAVQIRKNLSQCFLKKNFKHHQCHTKTLNVFSSRDRSLIKGFSSSTNIVQFNLSDIGEGIREVVLKEWFIKVGDRVAQFDSICEVQSDKASVTITSRYDGIIKRIYHNIDDIALVGHPLVDIELEGEASITSTDDFVEVPSSANEASTSEESDDSEDEIQKILATPAVRHLASQKKVNLKDVKGSGKHGRVLKDDILAFVKAIDCTVTESQTVQNEPLLDSQSQVKPLPTAVKFVGVPEDKMETITGIKKAMVKSMMAANMIPHFSFCDEVNLSSLVDLKDEFKVAAQKFGVKFSYTSVFVKAASVALNEFPLLNSSVDSECKTITYKGAHNIGVAMDSPTGLVVPNIKNVAQLSILEVASELNRLMQLGASGKLGPKDLTGGTFTLSNVGMIGGTYTKPIIFVPEVVIGALGSIMKVPRFNEKDQLIATHVMNVSWSADHRVIDGATMARYSNLFKSYLETPAKLLLYLK